MRNSGRFARRFTGGALGLLVLAGGPLLPAQAQEGARTMRQSAPPAIDPAGTIDWPLHNLNVRNTRFARPAQIDTTNVGRLRPWVRLARIVPDDRTARGGLDVERRPAVGPPLWSGADRTVAPILDLERGA